MKKLSFLFAILMIAAASLFAQAPQKFSYQAVVRNANNQLVASQAVGVRVSILQGGVSGTVVYMETQTAVTNTNGLITLQIGGGNVLSGNFATIDWSDGPFFLKTETDPAGGTNYTIEGTQQLLSVPYALYANEAGNGFSGDYNDLVNTPDIPTVPTNVSTFTNDAGYITMDSIPAIPTVPTNVSAFTNDAGYITMDSIPTIPTVPTNVSAFNNDAGYLTMDSIPDFPVIPTDISVFNNNVPYVTESELLLSINETNSTIVTLNSTIDSMNDAIDSLRHRIAELEGTHTAPTVVTTGVSNVAHTTATLNGSVVYSGGSTVAARGFCYGTEQNPTIESTAVSCGTGEGSFSANLQNLTPSTTYYVRAYAINVWGTNYGEQQTFTTLTEHAPTVEIIPVTDIDYTSFTCSGEVTDSGTYPVTARGICYATTPEPVMTGNHIHSGSGTGTFSATVTDLEPEIMYYVRAYAVNSVGVSYSNVIIVNTLTPSAPTVTTDSVSAYNVCEGTIVSDGGTPVTQRGFCYALHPTPTLNDSVVIVTGTDDMFTTTLRGLTMGLSYHVRAFATNAKGISYGDDIVFVAGCDLTPVVDYDGFSYNVVQIGIQCWMKENLRSTHYADGTEIAHTVSAYSDSIAYYYYPDNRYYNQTDYGLLYNWKALMGNSNFSNAYPSGVQGICPNGWHVPSLVEWNQLLNYVKSQEDYLCDVNTNAYLKALASTTGWISSSTACTPGNDMTTNNATGFSAMPAGIGNGWWFGQLAVYWTSSQGYNASYGAVYAMHNTYSSPNLMTLQDNYHDSNITQGFSVRCLKDF